MMTNEMHRLYYYYAWREFPLFTLAGVPPGSQRHFRHFGGDAPDPALPWAAIKSYTQEKAGGAEGRICFS